MIIRVECVKSRYGSQEQVKTREEEAVERQQEKDFRLLSSTR